MLLHDQRHPNQRGRVEIESLLMPLAVQAPEAAATQNQALNAMLLLYRAVLKLDVSKVNPVRAKRTQYLPTGLTKAEALALMQPIDGVPQWVVQ